MKRFFAAHTLVPMVLFSTIFFLLNTYIGNLRLFIDDFPYLLGVPSLTHTFSAFFLSYTILHGIYRPVALAYYWVIYTLYELSPYIAHAVPWAIHVATGFGLFVVLKKHGMRAVFALIAGLIFTLHPFASEQYMWLSANPGTVANLLCIIQLLLLSRIKNFDRALLSIIILSIISVFLYESTFFFFLPVGYLFWTTYPDAKKHPAKLTLLSLLPLFLYSVSKFIVQGSDPRPLVDNLSLLLHHTGEAMQNLVNVHLNNYYMSRFWTAYLLQGWNLFTSSPIFAFGLFTLAGSIGTIFSHNETDSKTNKHIFVFWILTFLSSIVPLFLNKEFYFGFRSLFLPTVTGIIVFLWIVQKIGYSHTQNAVRVLGMLIIGSFFLINITITTKFQERYVKDIRTTSTIGKIVQNEFPNSLPYTVNILLKSKISYDSRNTFLHADHMLGCLHHEWSAIPCLAIQTDRVGILAVEHADGRKTIQKGTDFNAILEKRPLLVLQQESDDSIIIEKVIR